jgi:uncharacterized protein
LNVQQDVGVFGSKIRAIALVVTAACSSGSAIAPEDCSVPPPSVRFPGGATLTVTVASDPASQAEGLMGVTDLPRDEGMAFVFEAATTATFWMKDTLIPLSIAFVDADDHIVTIRQMTPCERDPCPTYAADAPYVLAVEANEGWFTDNDVHVGDRASLLEPACG